MSSANAPAVPSTCYQIICDAMVDAGKLGQGNEPNSEQLTTHMRRLNKYVNYLQTQGAILWVQNDTTIAAPILQAGKGSYSIGPGSTDVVISSRPRRIIEGYFIDNAAVQVKRPLSIISRNEFDMLPTGVQTGTVVSVYVNKQMFPSSLPYMLFALWQTPDANAALGTLHLIVDQQIPNFSALTDTMYFPPEWALTLEWGLADQIATGMPQEVVDRCAAKSLQYESALLNWDVEDASTSFQPDPRGGYTGKKVGKY